MDKKILLVEDEIEVLELSKRKLERAGYNIVTASNGKEGLETASIESPDLIISDIIMPVMDGFAFYKALKERRDTSNIPVIMLTAKGQMKDTFMVMGIDDFITKHIFEVDYTCRNKNTK